MAPTPRSRATTVVDRKYRKIRPASRPKVRRSVSVVIPARRLKKTRGMAASISSRMKRSPTGSTMPTPGPRAAPTPPPTTIPRRIFVPRPNREGLGVSPVGAVNVYPPAG
jgi:hypothetical protein